MSGEDFFANYLTVLRTINPAASVPAVPSAGPVWQDRPKFFEIAQWIDGVYTLKAETAFDANTVLLFSGLPPTATIFKPDFAKEVFIGSHEFTDGLDPDDEWDGIDTMMTDAFGAITSDLKVWGRVWEVIDGFIRTIKDPCGPDPGTGPPPVADPTNFDYIIYNDTGQQIEWADFWFNSLDVYQCANIYFEYLPDGESISGNAEITDGEKRSDLVDGTFDLNGELADWTPIGPHFDTINNPEPFEYTIEW